MRHRGLLSNLNLKLFSVLVALLLSYAVNSESNSSVISLVVPIEIRNPPQGKTLILPVRRSVQVTIKGPSFIVGPVASSPPPLRVKLPAQSDDRFPVTFKSSDITLPPTVRVLGIEPSDIEFVFEPIQQREVKVEVPRIGQLPKQMALERVEISPKTVVVTGPRSEVAQIRALETEPIDLRELKGSTTVTLNLRMPGSKTTLSTSTVSASIEAATIPQERMIDGRPVEIRTAPELSGIRLDPAKVTVVVRGSPEAVAAADPASVIPYVRAKELPGADPLSLDVNVELPPGLTLVKVEPRRVQVLRESGTRPAIRSKPQKSR